MKRTSQKFCTKKELYCAVRNAIALTANQIHEEVVNDEQCALDDCNHLIIPVAIFDAICEKKCEVKYEEEL